MCDQNVYAYHEPSPHPAKEKRSCFFQYIRESLSLVPIIHYLKPAFLLLCKLEPFPLRQQLVRASPVTSVLWLTPFSYVLEENFALCRSTLRETFPALHIHHQMAKIHHHSLLSVCAKHYSSASSSSPSPYCEKQARKGVCHGMGNLLLHRIRKSTPFAVQRRVRTTHRAPPGTIFIRKNIKIAGDFSPMRGDDAEVLWWMMNVPHTSSSTGRFVCVCFCYGLLRS